MMLMAQRAADNNELNSGKARSERMVRFLTRFEKDGTLNVLHGVLHDAYNYSSAGTAYLMPGDSDLNLYDPMDLFLVEHVLLFGAELKSKGKLPDSQVDSMVEDYLLELFNTGPDPGAGRTVAPRARTDLR